MAAVRAVPDGRGGGGRAGAAGADGRVLDGPGGQPAPDRDGVRPGGGPGRGDRCGGRAVAARVGRGGAGAGGAAADPGDRAGAGGDPAVPLERAGDRLHHLRGGLLPGAGLDPARGGCAVAGVGGGGPDDGRGAVADPAVRRPAGGPAGDLRGAVGGDRGVVDLCDLGRDDLRGVRGRLPDLAGLHGGGLPGCLRRHGDDRGAGVAHGHGGRTAGPPPHRVAPPARCGPGGPAGPVRGGGTPGRPPVPLRGSRGGGVG